MGKMPPPSGSHSLPILEQNFRWDPILGRPSGCSTWWSIPLLTCFPGGALNSIDEPLTESLGSQKLMSLATVISKYFALTDVVYIPYIEVADR
ncbi:hypothetical protein F9C07_2284452 [Aspergillus flavus]|uniref:Uncharacterized protein n=1 Tax=Aspergillus flavus (strain ATCC 200026 / FGSC A1120 / IAM 13836 / NRRL 3357 / JCM 12722 / SRRC 167) TaxID=332952 RepID=A0A7U2MH98_ASPFN|nr:hypothetical protein F9C07_2284452 [Aspergillus flavus]